MIYKLEQKHLAISACLGPENDDLSHEPASSRREVESPRSTAEDQPSRPPGTEGSGMRYVNVFK